MELRDAVKQILKDNGLTQQWLSARLGYSNRSVLQSILARGNIELNNLLRICEEVGGKLIIRYGNGEVELTKKERR